MNSTTGWTRRNFLAGSAAAAGWSLVGGFLPVATATAAVKPSSGAIEITRADANFEREELIRPFGFKGGYMTEIWQTMAMLESAGGARKVGLCTQNVLWSDAKVLPVIRKPAATH